MSGNEEIIDYYKRYKRLYRILLMKAKKLYKSNLITNSSNNIRTAWNIIKHVTQQNKSSTIELENDNKLIKEPEIISNKFNEYFNGIPYSINSNGPGSLHNTLIECNANTFYLMPAMQYDILDIISNLKNNNSTDFMLNVKILKMAKNYNTQTLTYLINNSLGEGLFLECVKTAKIHLFINQVILSTLQILDQFPKLHPFPKFSKNMFLNA